MKVSSPRPPERPALLLTCAFCGRLHEPRRPLGFDLNPLCPACAPPEASAGVARVPPID